MIFGADAAVAGPLDPEVLSQSGAAPGARVLQEKDAA